MSKEFKLHKLKRKPVLPPHTPPRIQIQVVMRFVEANFSPDHL